MEQRPFTVREQDGILFLTLDTPGCVVNIFGNEAASQLLEILDQVSPQRARAVVFRTGKPQSFINGVGLLMAMTSISPDTAAELSGEVRRAYKAVERLPVPTIGEIQGNCYGCGVEFALRCKYRVAVDTAVTHFYMTEINDYLFVPVFEGTMRLPLLLGLESAIDLLLWGERWPVAQAAARGLIDQAVEPQAMEAGFAAFRERVLAGEMARRQFRAATDDEIVLQRAGERISRLPPSYQPLYRDCLQQMAAAARGGQVTDELIRHELELAGRSSAAPGSKSALSFFFVRQSAQHVCLQGREPQHDGWRIGVDPASPTARALGAELERRRLMQTQVKLGLDDSTQLALLGPESSDTTVRTAGANAATVILGVQTAALEPRCDRTLYGPLQPAPSRFLELATRRCPDPVAGELYAYLETVGFKVVVTHPQTSFLLDRWLFAYLAPLVRYTLGQGAADTVEASLRNFGCVRGPAELLGTLAREPLARRLAAQTGLSEEKTATALSRLAQPPPGSGRVDEQVSAALCLSLLAEAVHDLGSGELEHPALADLIARDLLDFPLQYGSMCQYFTPARVRELLRSEANLERLLGGGVLSTVESFASSKRALVL